jgi:hypothetical protein
MIINLELGFWNLGFGTCLHQPAGWQGRQAWDLELGIWILGFGFWILDFGFWILGFGIWDFHLISF